MSTSPDYGRAALYAAEQQLCRILDRARAGVAMELFGSSVVLPVEQKFQDLASVAHYVDEVHARTRSRIPQIPASAPALRERRGQSKAHYEFDSRVIALPLGSGWALREVVILHEYAHFVTHHSYPKATAHGSEFAGVMLEVVEQELGSQTAWLLGIIFSEAGVMI